MSSTSQNRRILVIDDNMAIHEDFRKILEQRLDTSLLQEARSGLFDDAPAQENLVQFEVECADQGQTGHRMVTEAVAQGRPYAMAFVDMRMPPGWDGIETIEHLWKVDPELQIVICTAFSDHDWDEVIQRLGQSDKLLILRKPFDNIEVWQLANSLTQRWQVSQQMKGQLDFIARLSEERAEDLLFESAPVQQEIASVPETSQ